MSSAAAASPEAAHPQRRPNLFSRLTGSSSSSSSTSPPTDGSNGPRPRRFVVPRPSGPPPPLMSRREMLERQDTIAAMYGYDTMGMGFSQPPAGTEFDLVIDTKMDAIHRE